VEAVVGEVDKYKQHLKYFSVFKHDHFQESE
jgi:hypothetical protein